MNFDSWKSLLASLTLATVSALSLGAGPFGQPMHAQEADAAYQEELLAEDDEEGEEAQDGGGEEAGEEGNSLEEISGPDPNARGAATTPYMHGVTDGKAEPLDLAALLEPQQRAALVAPGETLPPMGVGKGAVLCLSQQDLRLASKSLVDTDSLNEAQGQILRFHIWIKGEEVAQDGNLWTDAPALQLELYDDNGNLVTQVASAFKTRGTFPWHNYYLDLPVPAGFFLSGSGRSEAQKDQLLDVLGLASESTVIQPGLYLTLLARGTGKAYFGGLSYERIGRREQRVPKDSLDDATATFSPNPAFDELPMLLYYGLESRLPWRFLDGNHAFGSLRTLEGLKDYLQKAGNDWFHLQKGVAYLPYIYFTATTLKLTPGFEEGWLESLRSQLEKSQDPATGFWRVDGTPNLLATAALAQHCFSPAAIRHVDSPLKKTPWNAAGEAAELRMGVQIIRNLLKERVDGTAAWNSFAFQSPELKKEFGEGRTELIPTAAAARLLAHARDVLSPEEPEYARAEEALEEVYFHAVENFLVREGKYYVWKESNAPIQAAASPAGMLELLDALRVLEHRVNENLPLPAVTCRRRQSAGLDKADVTWAHPEKGLVAIRIYAAPEDVNPALLSEKHLVGIVERANAAPKAQDPLMLAYRLAEGGRRRWNVRPADLGAEYLSEKFANFAAYLGGPKNLTAGAAGEKPVTMNVSSPQAFGYAEDEGEQIAIKLYAAGVAPNGELTRCVPLDAED